MEALLPKRRPVHLAICDDDPDFRGLLGMRLSKDPGLRVVAQVGSLEDLKPVLADEFVHAVVIDYVLPGTTGAEAVRTVAARLRGRPVYVVSAAPLTVFEAPAIAAGARACFAKDGSVRELVASLSREFQRIAAA